MKLDDEILDRWWHANRAWHAGDIAAAEHLYRGLRRDHSIELFYEIQLRLPTRFVHPIGAVLGRATYAPHLVVYQGVSVGSTVDNERPVFTGPVALFPHSGVIGPVTVGKNVWISAGTIVQALPVEWLMIPDNVVVYQTLGRTGSANSDINAIPAMSVAWKPTQRSVIETFFTERHTTDKPSPLPSDAP